MLKIRLQRVGRKNDPSFRIVVVESQQGPKSGNHIEQVGFYNPKTKECRLDAERIVHWIGQGAQPSDTMHNLLIKEGVIEGKKKNALPKKVPIVKEQEENETVPKEEDGGEEETSDTPAEAQEDADTPVDDEKPAENQEEETETATESKDAEKTESEEKK